jgi:integrase
VPWTKATFSLPNQKSITKQRGRKPPKQATRDELQAILAECNDTWTAVFLYALNSGSGPTDCGLLKWDDIDGDGWVETPRNKTQRGRRFRLWPETREAIEKLRERHAQKGYDDGLVFHGRQGGNFIPKGSTNAISRRFRELATKAEVKRENLSFYSLRHTFQNTADEAGDFIATKFVMGHPLSSDISEQYRGTPSDERLERTTTHVRLWLFGSEVA